VLIVCIFLFRPWRSGGFGGDKKSLEYTIFWPFLHSGVWICIKNHIRVATHGYINGITQTHTSTLKYEHRHMIIEIIIIIITIIIVIITLVTTMEYLFK
jgi:heme/copper-type cytochrome/quinol oxidase subunit 2